MYIRSRKEKKNNIIPIIFAIILVIIGVFGAREYIFYYMKDISTPDKLLIKTTIEEVLEENPDLVINAINNYQKIAEEKHVSDVENKIKDHAQQIFSEKFTPENGNHEAKNTILYFYDYRCGHCKNATNTLNAVLKENKDLKVRYQPLAILGAESFEVAKAAIVVNQISKEKFNLFHNALFEKAGDATYMDIIKDLEIDEEKFLELMEDKAINDFMEQSIKVSYQANIVGTPTIFVDNKFIFGYDKSKIDNIISELNK